MVVGKVCCVSWSCFYIFLFDHNGLGCKWLCCACACPDKDVVKTPLLPPPPPAAKYPKPIKFPGYYRTYQPLSPWYAEI